MFVCCLLYIVLRICLHIIEFGMFVCCLLHMVLRICLHIGVLTPLENCFSCPHLSSPKHRPCLHPIRALCSWTYPKHCLGILRAGFLLIGMFKALSGHLKGILALYSWPCPKHRLGILKAFWLSAHGHVQSAVRAS